MEPSSQVQKYPEQKALSKILVLVKFVKAFERKSTDGVNAVWLLGLRTDRKLIFIFCLGMSEDTCTGLERVEQLLQVAGERETFDKGRVAANHLSLKVRRTSQSLPFQTVLPARSDDFAFDSDSYLQASETCSCENFIKILTELVRSVCFNFFCMSSLYSVCNMQGLVFERHGRRKAASYVSQYWPSRSSSSGHSLIGPYPHPYLLEEDARSSQETPACAIISV